MASPAARLGRRQRVHGHTAVGGRVDQGWGWRKMGEKVPRYQGGKERYFSMKTKHLKEKEPALEGVHHDSKTHIFLLIIIIKNTTVRYAKIMTNYNCKFE